MIQAMPRLAIPGSSHTTAAVAGGLAGLRGGMAGLPARWIAALPQHDFLDDCLAYLEGDPPAAAPRRAMR